MRPAFIDTDTASDDAIALMMAFTADTIDVVGIGVVAGNVPLDMAVQNALYTAELCGCDVPVYAGASKPLLRPLETAQFVHGQDGMGDIGLPLRGRVPRAGHAVEALLEAARANQGELELVTLGPLTNIAIALSERPGLAGEIARCTIMGGTSDYRGNVTPVSEYNVWADPEAAEIAFGSGMNMTMVGWDISRKYALFNREEQDELREIGTEKARVSIDCQKTLVEFVKGHIGVDAYDLPDPIAMAIALNPAIAVESIEAPVFVHTGHGPERGMTLIDDRRMLGASRPSTRIVTVADRPEFVGMLKRALA